MNDWQREFRRLERGVRIQVGFEPDEEGYWDRECPNTDCEFVFKVNAEDWRVLFKDEAIYCPQCGLDAPSDHWWTKEQVEHAKEQGFWEVGRRVDRAMQSFTKSMNRKAPKTGIITWKWKYHGRPMPRGVLPGKSREAFETKVQCIECGARYAVIGAAFFCPCCGHNGIEEQFEDTMQAMEQLDQHWSSICRAMEEALGKNAAVRELRHILEGAPVRRGDGLSASGRLSVHAPPKGSTCQGPCVPARPRRILPVETGHRRRVRSGLDRDGD